MDLYWWVSSTRHDFMLFQPPFYLYRTIPSILVDSIYKTSQFITSLHRLPTHRVKSFGNLYNSWFLGRINFGPYMNSFIDYTHIIGSASWPKIKNFQYHLSGVVEDLLGIHFLPMGK